MNYQFRVVFSFVLFLSGFVIATPAIAATVTIPVGTSIQAAIDANPAAATVYVLPAGTWHQQFITHIPANAQFIGDPNGGTILTGDDTTQVLYSYAESTGVLWKNITVEHYNTSTSECYLGAIHGPNSWTFDNDTFTLNNCSGLNLGHDSTVIGGRYSYNMHSGITGYKSDNAVINGAEIDHNNTRHDNPDNDAAGVKFATTVGMQIINNNVHDNYGQGLWCDIDCQNLTVSGNTVSNNAGVGIMYEISYAATAIHDNILVGNGEAAIYVSNSSGVSVYNNSIDVPTAPGPVDTTSGLFGGIMVIYDNRGTGSLGVYNTTNNNFHDNITTYRAVTNTVGVMPITGYFFDYNPTVGNSFTNTFTHNTYYVPNLTTQLWKYNNTPYVFAGWQGIGQDATGQVTVGLPSVTPPPTTGPCTNAYTSSVAVPTGYGAAYDVFSSGTMLIQADCTPATPKLAVGGGNQSQYIYKLGYVYKGGAWQAVNLTGSGALISSNWYAGSAQGALPLSATDLSSNWNYIVGYVCTWSGSAWKCGCADTACAASNWQLQAIKR